MVERIRQLLETRQLTPTQFADIIGVARPIVSHILSGRNKPSLEVVQRILTAMPDLSMPWLLNGTGAMLAAAPGAVAAPDTASSSAQVVVPSAPVPSPVSPPVAPIKAKEVVPRTSTAPKVEREAVKLPKLPAIKRFKATHPFSGAQTDVSEVVARDQRAVVGKAVVSVETPPVVQQVAGAPLPALPVPEVPAASSTVATTAAALLAGSEKAIRRIVIFYRDGSFADFQPE